jgi:hypothetical protein
MLRLVRARVRSITTLDDGDQHPKDPTLAYVGVTVGVGPADGPGEEYFYVDVATPDALKERLGDGELLVGRHLVITKRFDWGSVTEFLRARFEEPEAASWSELGVKLGRIGYWEFEDYQENKL